MSTLILVCGATGAGKTTYAIALARDIGAVRFSIDPWMQELFSNDMTSLDYGWITERVQRCHTVIWSTASQVLALGGNVILDLGFGSSAQRDEFASKAQAMGIAAEIHYLDTPVDERRRRVQRRNLNKEPDLYSFEVTDMMFDFMEGRFQVPGAGELENGLVVPPAQGSLR